MELPFDASDPDYVAKLNAMLSGQLQTPDAMQTSTDPGVEELNDPNNPNRAFNNPAMQDMTSTMFADTPAALMPQHGVPTPTGQSADLAMSSHDASIEGLKSRQATAQQNALDMLQKALNNQPEISSSQGIAAALLAAIPAIGGGLIGKMVGSPKIPAGTYFPGMSAQAFNQEFGVGGKAAAAEGAQIGGAAALDYLNRVQKDQLAKTPILEKMAMLYSQQANTLEGRLASAEQAKLSAEDRNVAREDQQAFMSEEKRLAREAGNKLPAELALMTPDQRKARMAKLAGIDENGNKPPADLPAAAREQLGKLQGIVNVARDVADRLSSKTKGFKTWAEMQAAGIVSLADTEDVAKSLDYLVDLSGRFKSGAVIPPVEKTQIRGFIAGDRSIPPEMVIKAIRNYANLESTYARGIVEFNNKINDPTQRDSLFAAVEAPKVSEDRLKHIESLIAKGG